MVETFKSMFEANSDAILNAQIQESKAKLASLEIDNRMKLAQNLMKMQQQISASSDPEEVKQQINELLQELMQANRTTE